MKAHVDLATEKIYGCKKGSWKWWHEKGHIEFNKDPNKSWLIMVKSYIFDFWMLFIMSALVWKPAFYLALIFWLEYMGIGIYEEWWCNKYAREKFTRTMK